MFFFVFLLLGGVPELRAGEDPAATLIGITARAEGADLLLGEAPRDPRELARAAALLAARGSGPGELGSFSSFSTAWLEARLPGESLAASPRPSSWAPSAWLLPFTRASIGDFEPTNVDGDPERGLISLRFGADALLTAGPWTLHARPILGGDVLGVTPAAGVSSPEAWLGFQGRYLEAGFGRKSRWIGPGRLGALLLSTNALAPPMGTVAGQGRLPGALDRLGRLRFETSAGWADQERGDVDDPGILLMDLRWAPIPLVEFGATRLEMFGGRGRPLPSLGELLLPTSPHVYDDPDKVLPDQNDLASLDFRVCLPLSSWETGRWRYVEAWWQYGAEDIIARRWAGIPYPSLAGVANLLGAEAMWRDFGLTVEFARIFDDYYRWYTRHRIYQEGFTQDGRVMGHQIGGDAESLAFRARWLPLPWMIEAWHERVLRVGVIESLGPHLFALASDETHLRQGVSLRRLTHGGGDASLAWELDLVRGADFVPDARRVDQRVTLSWTAGGVVTRGGVGSR